MKSLSMSWIGITFAAREYSCVGNPIAMRYLSPPRLRRLSMVITLASMSSPDGAEAHLSPALSCKHIMVVAAQCGNRFMSFAPSLRNLQTERI